MQIIEKLVPSTLLCGPVNPVEGYLSEFSKWGSVGLKVLGGTGKFLALYLPLNYLGQNLCHFDPQTSFWVSLGITTAGSVALALTSYKELILPRNEIIQTVQLYKPKIGCNLFGQRIPSFYPRIPGFLITVAVEEFLRGLAEDSHYMGLTSLPGQLILLGPFALETLFPALSQFFDKHLTDIAHWFATGCPTCCGKILPFIDRDLARANTIRLYKRVQKFRFQVSKLNPEFINILYADIKPGETTSLLAAQAVHEVE